MSDQHPPTVRLARNVAEKQRRDKLNSYINELANSVPLVANATKRLDKTSILRLAAAFLRLQNSPLRSLAQKELAEEISNGPVANWKPKHFNLDSIKSLIEAVDGFVIVVNADQKIMYVSPSCEKYLGHQNIDLMGYPLLNFIHPGDVELVTRTMEKVAQDISDGRKVSERITFRCRMRERSQPRTDVVTYQVVLISGSLHVESHMDTGSASEIVEKSNSRKRPHDMSTSTSSSPSPSSTLSPSSSSSTLSSQCLFKGFVQVIPTSPSAELSLIDANQEEYVSRLSLDGTLLYADHRISMITGFMPDEVIGISAYGFILVPDHVISLFAHKLMLSNSNGTGIIVHRLKKRTGGYVYLQSAGCLQYDRNTGQVDHFICVSRHLHEEEGNKERQKFVKKFTPHTANDSPKTLMESLHLVIGPRSNSSLPINNNNENQPNNAAVKALKYSSTTVPGSFAGTDLSPYPSSSSDSAYFSAYSTQSPESMSSPSLPLSIQPLIQPPVTVFSPPLVPHFETQIIGPPFVYQPQFIPGYIQFPVQHTNLIFDPRNPVVNVRLPDDASFIREDGTFRDTRTISVAPLPIAERSSIPSNSFDEPDLSSHDFRSLLQPTHNILDQLRKHAISGKFTMSQKSHNVIENPDTAMNFMRVSQSNGPGELMTGSLVFGYEQIPSGLNQFSVNQDPNVFPPPLPFQQQQVTFLSPEQQMLCQNSSIQSITQAPLSLVHVTNSTSLEEPSRLTTPFPSDAASQSLAYLEEFAKSFSTGDPTPAVQGNPSTNYSSSDLFAFNNQSSDINNVSNYQVSDANSLMVSQFNADNLIPESVEDKYCHKKPRLTQSFPPTQPPPNQSSDGSS